MPIITIISDWNKNDYYLGALKGSLLKQCPEINLIDISHNILNYNSAQAAFVLKNSYKNFPENTIHLIAVNCEDSENHPFVIIKNDNQYFIGPDNGMFGLVFKENPKEIIQLDTSSFPTTSFPELNILSKVACKLALGSKITELGKVKQVINRQIPLRPTIDPGVIMGSIIYIDSYSNVITNISEELFKKERNNKKFTIYVGSNHYTIDSINTKYNETQIGDLLAIFNSAGLMEIAINKGQISTLLNLKINSHIRIKFHDNKNR